MTRQAVHLDQLGLITGVNGVRFCRPGKMENREIDPLRSRWDGASLGVADRTYEQCRFDKMICAVASRQDLHLAQFFEILDLMGFPVGQSTRAPELRIVVGYEYQGRVPLSSSIRSSKRRHLSCTSK
ncbi:hypothetical protein BKA82DRAFT_2836307 [Pisolithus tinctorius]|nr:hypothetical protein BKA82DRAFT_2836307 [Pisolithus tinctorius]